MVCLSEDILRADKIYRYLKVLFCGVHLLLIELQIPAVYEVFKLCRSVYNEKHQFIEFCVFPRCRKAF